MVLQAAGFSAASIHQNLAQYHESCCTLGLQIDSLAEGGMVDLSRHH
jgi:hypothetical protein